jgi:hypothetical protein
MQLCMWLSGCATLVLPDVQSKPVTALVMPCTTPRMQKGNGCQSQGVVLVTGQIASQSSSAVK